MKYKTNKNSNKKAYIQLYEQIKADIIEGLYKFGSKLPSKRTLAVEVGVSVITVEHTFALLCDEGYVESRQRSGYYCIYKKSDFLGSTPTATADNFGNVIHHANNYIPFSVLSRTMRKVINDRQESLLIKSPNHGTPQLRSAISAYLKRSQSINTQNAQIIIGSGAEYLYSLIAQLFGDTTIAIEDPSYDKINRVYSACRLKTEKLKLGKDGIKTSELNRTTATVLHITPFMSYPSGISASASKRAEYLQWAKDRSGYIVEDNYDSELTVSTKNEDTVYSLDNFECVIYLNTFSRTVAPSIRVGYMVLPQKLVPLFEQKLGFYSCTVPLFEQYVLAELINSGDFERHVNRIRRQRRKLLK